ncbi:MAG: TetR/AcrR family transcriptional regulator [Dehalococcoidia bacterium]|nr:TetR/AcrR family transcriptional regulator [Dehalococcoidia bacterium]
MARVTEAHLEARRDQIVNAAWACFARRGYHQTTMQDIATEAGLSAGAIYRYYPSKEAVLEAINDRSQEMGRAMVEWARSRAEGPLGALEVIGQTMFSRFEDPLFETLTRVNIEIWPEIIRSDVLREGLRKEMTFWRGAVTQLLSEAQERGHLNAEVDPAALATLLICAWEGLRHYRLVNEDFKPEAIVEVVRALVPEEVRSQAEQLGQIVATHPVSERQVTWEPPHWLGSPQRGPSKKEAGDADVRP